MPGTLTSRWVLACGVALIVACSSPSTSDMTGSGTVSTSPPIITHVQQRLQRSWEPADELAGAEADINATLEASSASTLLPRQMPAQTSHSTARLTVNEMAPTGTVVVDLSVSFTRDGQERSLALTRLPAAAEAPDCNDRVEAGAGGVPGWEVISVRDSTGCTVTNETGLGFIEWEEGSSRFHVETRMDINEAVAWLETWKSRP